MPAWAVNCAASPVAAADMAATLSASTVVDVLGQDQAVVGGHEQPGHLVDLLPDLAQRLERLVRVERGTLDRPIRWRAGVRRRLAHRQRCAEGLVVGVGTRHTDRLVSMRLMLWRASARFARSRSSTR